MNCSICGSDTRVISVRSNKQGVRERERQCKDEYCTVRLKTHELTSSQLIEKLDKVLPINLVNKILYIIGIEFDDKKQRGAYDLFDFDFYFLDEFSDQGLLYIDDLIVDCKPKSIKKINNSDISNKLCDCGLGTKVIDVRLNKQGIKVRLRQCNNCKMRTRTHELSTFKIMEILDNHFPVFVVDKISNALGVVFDNQESEENGYSDFYFIDESSNQDTSSDLFDDININNEPKFIEKRNAKDNHYIQCDFDDLWVHTEDKIN